MVIQIGLSNIIIAKSRLKIILILINQGGKYTFPSIQAVSKEIDDIKNDLKEMKFTNKVAMKKPSNETITRLTNTTNIDFSEAYDLTKGTPIESLNIEIGSDVILRHSCSCHKLNLVVRHAIDRHSGIREAIEELNSSNKKIRKTIELNRAFRNLKCRLRLVNLTRWSSVYLLLESVKKAYEKSD